jgi:peptidoglycan/xylan/chitin deacetylase (PgdA/CDA1 family)
VARQRSLVVLRRNIETDPLPVGGTFGDVALRPAPVLSPLARWLSVYCVDTAERVVSLTYDDGPHPQHTPRILDVLAETGATATFFVLTRQVRAHPAIVRRILAEGHEIGLHGDDHTSLLVMGTREAVTRVRRARAELEDVVGQRVRLYRPPYGLGRIRQLTALAALGLEIVIWTGAAVDWLHDDEGAIADRAVRESFPGGFLLLHDDRGDPETIGKNELLPAFDRAEVARLIIDGLHADGYTTATVGSLLQRFPAVRTINRESTQWGS